eukprot:934255-Rhodomonas_salina.1
MECEAALHAADVNSAALQAEVDSLREHNVRLLENARLPGGGNSLPPRADDPEVPGGTDGDTRQVGDEEAVEGAGSQDSLDGNVFGRGFGM